MSEGAAVSERPHGNLPKRLGVLGTLVRDTIHPPGGGPPATGWGGIAYALAGFELALVPEWTAVPLVKVGRDIAPRAIPFLRSFTTIGDLDCVCLVPEANNRVELTYRTQSERVEVLSGGVPGWTPDELCDVLPTLDALYLNFISGSEVDLAGAEWLRDRFDRPTYADLHSLFLDIADDGRRSPRYLPSGERWVGCFDTVQMNQNEFKLLLPEVADPWREAARAVAGRAGTIAVTRGAEGVELLTSDPGGGPPRRGHVPVPDGAAPGDPTGCGDVWGATFFAARLGGAGLRAAARHANTMARAKLRFSGAEAFRDGASRQTGSDWS